MPITSSNEVKDIIDKYNSYAKAIAVKFKKYCDKYNFNLLYDLSKKRKKDGTCFVNKQKLNYMISLLCNMAEAYKWKDFKLSDYRVEDIDEDSRSSIDIEFSFSKACANLGTLCDYKDNDFIFYGWNYSGKPEDPYEIDICGGDNCYSLIKDSLDIIINSAGLDDYVTE